MTQEALGISSNAIDADSPARSQDVIRDLLTAGGYTLKLPLKGGSMRYTIPGGSTVKVMPPDHLRRGDVCLYISDGLVAHRLVRQERLAGEDVCVMRGEQHDAQLEYIARTRVIGRVCAVSDAGWHRDLDSRRQRLLGSLWVRFPALVRSAYSARALIRRILRGARSLSPVDNVDAFLLACLAGHRPSKAFCSGRSLDWQEVKRRAQLSHILPMIEPAVVNAQVELGLTSGDRFVFIQAYQANVRRTALIAEELRQILIAMRAAGISLIVLKGAALMQTLWENSGLRWMSDIDLLIQDHELSNAAQVMSHLGYNHEDGGNSRMDYDRHHHLAPYRKHGAVAAVEIHRDLSPSWAGIQLDIPGFWKRAESVKLSGVAALVLSPADLMLHLCVHTTADDVFQGKARSLADLCRLVSRAGDDFDWDCVAESAASPRLARMVYYPLLAVRDLLAQPVPDRVMWRLRKAARTSAAADRLLRFLIRRHLITKEDTYYILPSWMAAALCEGCVRTGSAAAAGVFALRTALKAGTNPTERAGGLRALSGLAVAMFRRIGKVEKNQSFVSQYSQNDVIEISSLSKCFPERASLGQTLRHPFARQEVKALRDVNLTVGRGEVFGLLGPNGAGKTTLIKILCTLVLPDQGTVRVNGLDVARHGAQVRRSIGLVVSDERSFFWRLTGRQNLQFFATLSNLTRTKASEAIEETTALLDLTAFIDRPFKDYSAGMRQRLALARGLLTRADIIVLDEPTRNLDPLAAASLRRFVKDELVMRARKTVLLATNNLQEAEEMCDRLAILNCGSIRFSGRLDELRKQFIRNRVYSLIVEGPMERVRSAIDMRAEDCRILDAKKLDADGCWELRLSVSETSGGIAGIVDRVVRSGVRLMECSQEKPSLEQIFEGAVKLQS